MPLLILALIAAGIVGIGFLGRRQTAPMPSGSSGQRPQLPSTTGPRQDTSPTLPIVPGGYGVVTAENGANLHAAPNGGSRIVKTLRFNELFSILSADTPGWLRVVVLTPEGPLPRTLGWLWEPLTARV